MVLAIAGKSTANGANVIQWNLSRNPDGSPTQDQQWRSPINEEFWYNFRNAGTTDQKALTIKGNTDQPGAEIIQWTYSASNVYQQWSMQTVSNGWYRIWNRRTGLCLAVA